MNPFRLGLAFVIFASLFSFGCQNKMAEENKALWKQCNELQAAKADLEARLRAAPDPAAVQSMQSELAQRNSEIAELKASFQKQTVAAPKESKDDFGGLDATFDHKTGTVTVTLPAGVLFPSGSDTVKDSAKSTLNTIIAQIKKRYVGKQIFVDGHTDTDPISRTKEKWDDNLELSAARAISVARYLTAHGLPAKQVAVRGYGDTHPKATKQASRRVEIVVVAR